MRTGHMSVHRGKRVIVHLRDGTKVIGKFHESDDRTVTIDDQKIPARLIRTISIYKEK